MSLFAVTRATLRSPALTTTRACSACARASIASTIYTGAPAIPCPAARGASPLTRGAGAGFVRALEQVRGMKVRSSVKKLCDGCSVVRR